jgi:signal transduction histidine kinase
MDNIEALKEELKQTKLAYQMALQMSQFKGGFLMRIGHEFRSPLSSLIGLHQLILSDLCETREEEKKFIEDAYKSALKLIKIIDEVINVSKIENGRVQLEITSISLDIVLNTIRDLTHLQAANKNIPLEFLPVAPTIEVSIDLSRFIQALVYAIDSGIILLKEGQIKIRVSDSQEEGLVKIWLDIYSPVKIAIESINLHDTFPIERIENLQATGKQLELSPFTKILLAQNLLETMGGSLKIAPAPLGETTITRLECLVPLAEVPMN